MCVSQAGGTKSKVVVRPGLLRLPGSTPETRKLLEELLERDLREHHAFWGKAGFHNHLPHHLLALHDLGAPATILQAAYAHEAEHLSPILLIDRTNGILAEKIDLQITEENWTEHLGNEKNYLPYLSFFERELQRSNPQACLDEYIFSPKANGNQNEMLLRMVGAAVHPLIQIGYGLEFSSLSILASGFAETCVTRPLFSSIYSEELGPKESSSLLEILRDMYDADVLRPVMPYDPNALLRKRYNDALKDGRPEAIRELVCKWRIGTDVSEEELEKRVEEAMWGATLVLAGTGKPGKKPRMDFFLMHLLTSSLFLSTFMKKIKRTEDKCRVLRAYLSTFLLIMLVRGRPQIDVGLIMSYPEKPRPKKSTECERADDTNPWLEIVHSALHAPESHVSKSIRALLFAAQQYGETGIGRAPGATSRAGGETIRDAKKLDGTVFVRAAGVLMDALGWTGHGEEARNWDRSAHGWDEAWNNEG